MSSTNLHAQAIELIEWAEQIAKKNGYTTTGVLGELQTLTQLGIDAEEAKKEIEKMNER